MLVFNLVMSLLAAASSVVLAAPVAEPEAFPPTAIEKRTVQAGTLTATAAVTPSAGVSFGSVSINGKASSVMYDTGSNILWIKADGTNTATGPAYTQGYGSGRVWGNIAYGTVSIGGVSVPNQAYLVVTGTDSDYYKNVNGIMGLGTATTIFGSTSASGPSWLSQALPQLKAPTLGVNIASGGSGTFFFGTSDPSVSSAPTYVPYGQSPGYATLDVSSFGIDSTTSAGATCGVDTGTTAVYVPNAFVTTYWSQLSSARQDGTSALRYRFSCAQTAQDGSIKPWIMSTAGRSFSNPGKYLVATVDKSADYCGGYLQGSTPCILGQKFFYNWYTVFDFGSKTIGLAPK